ncbi:MAG: IS256 family transposase [Chlorobiales bacterium]|nr:IS256 family transposase [Chlorobiales bacterium]
MSEAFDFKAFQAQAIEDLKAGKPLQGKEGIFTPLIKQIVELALEGELDAHLSEEKRALGNRKNGKVSKRVKTGMGSFELETPRDRDASFDPQLVKKRQTILGESLEQKVMGLYGIGMSYEDIAAHLDEMYGVDLSPAMMTAITDKIIPRLREWQTRPLESVYPIVWMDALFYKVRQEGQVVSKAIYVVLGVNTGGLREVLGLYSCETESARFWLGVLDDLKQRGVKDILIACIDNLTGFEEAIGTVFRETEVQLCVVHQIRNSLKYLSTKDARAFMPDLKRVYQAMTREEAEQALDELETKWGKKYPMVIRSWRQNWAALSSFFNYPPAIRKVIYTTNPIENLNRQLRKVTKTKGAFVSETALLKLLYLAIMRISGKWVMPVSGWNTTLAQLTILFGDRLNQK